MWVLGNCGSCKCKVVHALLLLLPRAAYLLMRSTPHAGTLYIQLPTAYQGGRLVVSHGGRNLDFDFSADSAFNMHYAAFYASCIHEVGRWHVGCMGSVFPALAPAAHRGHSAVLHDMGLHC